MVLNNLQLINTNRVISLQITGKLITGVSDTDTSSLRRSFNITFNNAVVLPGLINSHDHLDFNLFPQLGTSVYNNYTEWASSIHRNYKEEIGAVLRVPEELRVQWGIYKNLLCGITTVVNHGKALREKEHLITVLENTESLHSVAFEKKFKLKLNNPFKINTPVAIHCGEGIDEFAGGEIDELIKCNLLKRKLVGIHGVAMNVKQVLQFDALVWCPASNYFLFNRTADINQLKEGTTVCFGSDSTLTAGWNIWEHLRLANRQTGTTSIELLQMLTQNPAKVWRLNGGAIKEGKDADIVIVKAPAGGLLINITPEDILLVIHKGEICLFDDALSNQLSDANFHQYFSTLEINESIKHIKGNVHQLISGIRQYLPGAVLPVKPVHKPVTA
jgi:cytosine/adenosine deaminase-related metal-dependent hydrolase